MRVETNVLEVKFKIVLQDSESSHLAVPAQPMRYHTHLPLCSVVSDLSPCNSSHHSLEAL